MEHLGTITLETERLILRRFKEEDSKEMFNNYTNDPEVCKYLTWAPHKTEAVTKELLKSWISNYEKLNYYNYAIVIKETNTLIGSISVTNMKEEAELIEIGYCIGSKWWGNGYTCEALKRLIKFFFENVYVNRIQLTYDSKNENSGKVMKKAGLSYESTAKDAGFNNLGLCDMITYSILSLDYFSKIKKATRNEVDLVTTLLAKHFKEDYYILRKEIDDQIDSESSHFFLFEDKGVAHVTIRYDYLNGKVFLGPCGFLEGIYVLEEYRNNLIATRLVEFIEHFLVENGYPEILSDCLINNKLSYDFHLKLGFKEVGKMVCFQKTLLPEKNCY